MRPVLLLLILLASCAPRYAFTKPDFNQADFQRDGYECERDMRAGAASFGGGWYGDVLAQRFLVQCMQVRGYTLTEVDPTGDSGRGPSRQQCEEGCRALNASDGCYDTCTRYPVR